VVENSAVIGSQQPFDPSRIVVLSGLESVRQRPALYVGATETEGIHKLLQFTIDGVLAHYQTLDWPLERIVVWLEEASSMTVAANGPVVEDAALDEGSNFLERELQVLGVGFPLGLFVINALSSRLVATTRLPHQRRRRLTFERGVLCHDQVNAARTDTDDFIVTFWPDTTILEPGTFNNTLVQQEVRSFNDANPTVTIDVVDGRQARDKTLFTRA